ncbi:Maternal protein pumilio [Aphelenchoides bicaudatus]|nr:Maternal protein pumilio [Aphelenchoides bicaudatus]
MAMAAEQQQQSGVWEQSMHPASVHAISKPIMVPAQQGNSPMGDQSGLYHAMIEDVLNSPGVLPNRDLKYAGSIHAPFGTPPANYNYTLSTPPTSQMFSNSPPNFPMAYPNNGMICGLPQAMAQMTMNGPSAISPRRDSFGSSGPQINGVRAYPPQGYYVIPTSPPVSSIDSSPSHLVYATGLYQNGVQQPIPNRALPPNAVYNMAPPARPFNGGPSHFNTAQQVAPHVTGMPRRNNGGTNLGNRAPVMHVMAVNDEKTSNRSQILDDFRNSRLPQLQLSDLSTHVVEFSQDQHGSRFIQQKLERASLREKQLVFAEVIENSNQLMTDVFGNYVIQKFFEFGTPEQKAQLIGKIRGNVLSLALQMYGCRVIQKALETISQTEQMELLKEMEGKILKCIKDQNGNHVIQKIIERVDPEKLGFIVEALTNDGPNTITLSTHPYGCRVVQRVLEHCTEEQKRPVLEQIHANIHTLIVDQYGNYVVQHVIERGSDEDRDRIIEQIKGKVMTYAQHKFSSNVIEKCLTCGNNNHKTILITEACGDGMNSSGQPLLLEMMKDQFANYVVQKMLDVADSNNRKKIMLAIKPHIPMLRKFSYGKHIIAKLEKYFSKQNGSSPFQDYSPTEFSAQQAMF